MKIIIMSGLIRTVIIIMMVILVDGVEGSYGVRRVPLCPVYGL